MKINETGRVGAVNHYQRQMESKMKDAGGKAQRKDEVSISAEAMEMLKAQEIGQDPARTERIENLKSQVDSGTYHVETGALADKLAPYFKSYIKD